MRSSDSGRKYNTGVTEGLNFSKFRHGEKKKVINGSAEIKKKKKNKSKPLVELSTALQTQQYKATNYPGSPPAGLRVE